jgi:indole-3-glycerol phosphate synthase
LADRGGRRFSQAISEGDGISVIVEVDGVEIARGAEAEGAEALAVAGDATAIRAVSDLPILCAGGTLDDAAERGADAWIVDADAADAHDVVVNAERLGLDAVVSVRDEEELERVLERHDPEIFLLAGNDLEHALELLSDVPVGKLAIVRADGLTREHVLELERRGMDAVIVPPRNVAELVGAAPPTV